MEDKMDEIRELAEILRKSENIVFFKVPESVQNREFRISEALTDCGMRSLRLSVHPSNWCHTPSI